MNGIVANRFTSPLERLKRLTTGSAAIVICSRCDAAADADSPPSGVNGTFSPMMTRAAPLATADRTESGTNKGGR
jgi:hypothetical protein